MIGTRIEYDGTGIPDAGCYWKRDGVWYGMTPNGHMANLANHQVVEHEDGTITVAPSVLVQRPGGLADNMITVRGSERYVELWHGFIERGVWRAC